jgi:hypothetical protein
VDVYKGDVHVRDDIAPAGYAATCTGTDNNSNSATMNKRLQVRHINSFIIRSAAVFCKGI